MATPAAPSSWIGRFRALYRSDPGGTSIDLLRIGMGIVWALDLIFILDPANQYFPTFASVAQGYGTQTYGGPAIANFVAAHAPVFAWLIAIATAYLAVALLLGITTRLACGVGIVASAFFLLTQFNMTFMIPGGTDVGAHPLYLLAYLVLIAGGAGRYFAADAALWTDGPLRVPRLARALAAAPAPAVAAAPVAARTGRRFAALTVLAVVSFSVLMAATAAEAMAPPSAPATASSVQIVDISYEILYPGNASSGAVGPAQQDGCFSCAQAVSPGNTTTEEVMLTTRGAGGTTVSALSVAAPFSIVHGPSLPATVKPNAMWMFGLELRTPVAPGDYTVQLNFTVA
jgi:hypothetical protein